MNEDDGDDPFACFDSSEDDESDAGPSEIPDKTQRPRRQRQPQEEEEEAVERLPGNGVLAFHAGTEVALLHHVRTELSSGKKATRDLSHSGSASEDGENDGDAKRLTTTREIVGNAQRVLDLVDAYCMSRHWMMHVGPEKAKPLRKFIGDFLAEQEPSGDGSIATFVELGTYCGYSSVFIAKTVLEHCWSNGKPIRNNSVGGPSTATDTNDAFSFHIYTVEVVEKFANVAKELIRLAGMEDYISIVLMKDPDAISTARDGEERSLSSKLKRRLPVCTDDANAAIDFLFVDHDKSMYLPNLRELEDAGMIRKGTYVAADNVVFAEIDDYRNYMADRADKGIVATRLEDSLLVEYCQPDLVSEATAVDAMSEIKDKNNASTTIKDTMRDGIEFSVYLQDPR
jgi:catechol O-methyltransferase